MCFGAILGAAGASASTISTASTVAKVATGAGTLIQMSAQQKAAQATAQNERRVAAQMIIDREMGKVQAMQKQNQRVEDYLSAEKSNLAIFSASGVDVESESIKAFEKDSAATVGEDLNAIALQADYQSRSRTIESGLATERSSNALSAGYANMMGTATTGIYNLAKMWT
jgi:hypothetical protein|tara:strand:+ start:1421 stop:1930 length:510 start_codon:yes stop_codon:yes gene_type:complete